MSILFILIIISLTLASGFLIAFFWAVRSGQFEDDFTPSVRILFDDEMITDNDEAILKKEIETEEKVTRTIKDEIILNEN
jgi:cbb3-type cytochrome oxidase maturation protein